MSGCFHFLEVALIVAGSLIGLTLVLAAPIEWIPGVDVSYHVAGALFLVWYWATLFKAVADIAARRRATIRVVTRNQQTALDTAETDSSADQSALLEYKSENRRWRAGSANMSDTSRPQLFASRELPRRLASC